MNMDSFQKSVCFTGIFIALLPFLGFPGVWENFFMFMCGLSVVFLTIKSARHKKSFGEKVFDSAKSIVSQVFVENNPTVNR